MTQKEFLNDVAHRLYVSNTEISGLKYQPFDFIEAKRKEIRCPEIVFYQNLAHAMPNHFGAKTRPEFFKEVLRYCKKKIRKIEKEKKLQAKAKLPNSNAALTQAKPKPEVKNLLYTSLNEVLRPEFENRLAIIEGTIHDKVSDWKAGNDKIECAAFVELLYEKKYLLHGKDNRKRCISFAQIRYNIDISVQIQTGNDIARNSYKRLLEKCFK